MSTAHYSQAVEQIGDAAGQVWHYLSENGPTALSRLAKDVDIPRRVDASHRLVVTKTKSRSTPTRALKTVSLH